MLSLMIGLLCAPTAHAQELTPVDIGVDVVPLVGTSSWAQGRDRRSLSLNLIAGYTGAVEGIELGMGLNINRLYMHGVQLSGFGNLVGEDVEGIQLTNGINLVGGSVDGIQLSGGVNMVGGSVDGFQAGAGANVAGLDVDGFQAAGGVNVAGGSVDGVQAAVGVNVAGGVVDGFQAAAGVNVSGGVDGVQLAPVNVAAGHVDGIQVGLVNVARSSDFSLGLVNIIWEGRTHVDVWATEDGFGNVALKHGGETFHYLYGVGYRSGPEEDQFAWSPIIGAGGHFTLAERLYLDADLYARHVNESEGWTNSLNTQTTGRLVAGLSLGHRLAIFAGPSYNVRISATDCAPKVAGPWTTVFIDEREGPVSVRGWPGWTVGVQLL
ncbi:MAG: hypothetical protein AAFV53_25685 [Myxococcota bacterium]